MPDRSAFGTPSGRSAWRWPATTSKTRTRIEVSAKLRESTRPAARPVEICALRGRSVPTVRRVVALIAAAVTGGLDLRAFAPFVVARDRDEVGVRPDRCAPHRVVRLAVVARLDRRIPGSEARIEA